VLIPAAYFAISEVSNQTAAQTLKLVRPHRAEPLFQPPAASQVAFHLQASSLSDTAARSLAWLMGDVELLVNGICIHLGRDLG
jgi:hypothetical protein